MQMMNDFTQLQKLAITAAFLQIDGNVCHAVAMLLNIDADCVDAASDKQKGDMLIWTARHSFVSKSAFADALREIGRDLEIVELGTLADDVQSSSDVLEQRGRAIMLESLRAEREQIKKREAMGAEREQVENNEAMDAERDACWEEVE
jgi:hypothetical protein